MYKISDFSRITKLTIKALRYYDEEDILKPSYRNQENSYRYYNDEDFQKAQLIVLLRDFDFSISEIKDVLKTCEKPEDLSYYLTEKKGMIENKIAKERELVSRITHYVKSNKVEEIRMDYKIEGKEVAPVTVLSIRYRGKYSDVGQHIGKLYQVAKNNATGAPFNCYYDSEYQEDADIELCLPTTKPILSKDISSKTLPAIKALSTIHQGNYETLNYAYKALLDYAKSHSLHLTTPSREIYVKGPGMIFKGNANQYITEILIPFEENEV